MAKQEGTPTGDRWASLPIQSKGGLILNVDALSQGTSLPGSARVLQNFECSVSGGYRRIDGFTKWDSTTVPGTTSNPVLGVKAALGGVFAARKTTATPTTDIYYSTGSGWSSRINTANRGGSPSRVRMIEYVLFSPKIAGVDGVNYGFIYDGTTYTLLNGTGAPADPKYVEFFLNRLVFAGYSSNGSAIILTAPNTDSDFDGTHGAIEINVGDTITGLKAFRNQLYIFSKNNIYKLVGTTTADFVIQPVTAEIGCIAGDTIQEVGGDLIYLAPDGFRSVAGTYNIGDVDLSLQSRAIQQLLASEVIANTNISQFVAFPIRKKSQYRCMFYDPNTPKANALGVIGKIEQGSPTEAFNYIYTSYAWSTTVGIQAYCGDSYFDSGVERVVIGDPTNGFVYLLEHGNDFDGTAIQAIYSSPYITFQDATIRKVMQKINVYTEAEGNASINLGLNFDFNNIGILQPATQALTITGSFPVYGSGIYGTDVFASVFFPVFKKNLIGSGFTTAFTFSSNGGAPFRIDSFQITYAPKSRR